MNNKPENSPTFFSALKPQSTVFGGFSIGGPEDMGHSERYFIAGGESLAKIHELIASAERVNADLQALALEVGADPTTYLFTFKDAETVPVVPVPRLKYRQNTLFVCDAANPGKFVVDRGYRLGQDAHEEVLAVKAITGTAADEARTALAAKYQADLFDGNFFYFADWEDQLVPIPPPQEHSRKVRLKSNPSFIRGIYDGANHFSPDYETDEGFRIGRKQTKIRERQFPDRLYAEWINSFELDISYHGGNGTNGRAPVSVISIDGDYIISVPVITEKMYGRNNCGGTVSDVKEGWVMPPGAKPIRVSEYYARLERSGTLRALPLTPAAAG